MENQGRKHRLTLWIIFLVASITMLIIASSILHYEPSASGGTFFDAIGAFLPYGLIIAIAVYYFLKSDIMPSRPALSATGVSILRLVRYLLLMMGGMLLSMAPFILAFLALAQFGLKIDQTGTTSQQFPIVPNKPIEVGPPAFDLWSFLAISSVIFVFATLLLATFVKVKGDHMEETIDEELGRTISASYATNRFADDRYRRAILSYYARGREHMTSQGVPLTEAMTPREFEKNVINSINKARESFTPLTHLFEEARFSIHSMGASEKLEAKRNYENLKTINLRERKRVE